MKASQSLESEADMIEMVKAFNPVKFVEIVRQEVGYELVCGESKIPLPLLYVVVSIVVIKVAFQSLYCTLFGHKIVDDSFAGPDNGNMDHHCSRCGASWSVPLY